MCLPTTRRTDCAQGAAYESLRSRRQGRQAVRFSASAVAARGPKRRGSPRSPGPRRRRRSTMAVRCSAATPTARQARRRSPSRHSALCRTARWCGARPPKSGDDVVVTGTIGDAALGLKLRRDAVSPSTGSSLMLRPRSWGALSAAAAAQHAGRSGPALRVGGDRRLRWACRRSRQAMPRLLGRGRHRRYASAALGRRARSASPPSPSCWRRC